MKYYLIAGEASGDLHASYLMRQLLQQDPQADFRFYGGDAMQAVGGQLVCHYKELAFMGFAEVIKHLPQLLRNMSRCQDDIQAFQPDALILVDYPGFNLRVAGWVKKHLPQVKVCYYISPKIWAWKEYRLREIRRNVDCLLSILPFEVEWFRQRSYEVTFVGNPTVEELAPITATPFDREAFCQRHDLNVNQSIIAVLPGSRVNEVQSNLPTMLDAVTTISCHQVVIARAPGVSRQIYTEIMNRYQMVPRVKVVVGETYDLLRAAEAAVVTSGTATLETACLRCPQVVCYHMRGGRLAYGIMKRVLRNIRYVSLVNLILDGITPPHQLREPAVRELLGYQFTTEALRREVLSLCGDSAERRQMLSQYDRMMSALGGTGASVRAAQAIIRLLH